MPLDGLAVPVGQIIIVVEARQWLLLNLYTAIGGGVRVLHFALSTGRQGPAAKAGAKAEAVQGEICEPGATLDILPCFLNKCFIF